MSNVDLREGNKKLAEFMGWNFVGSDSEFVEGWGSWYGDGFEFICDDDELSFGSWDDIMEVVDKIESMGYDSNIEFTNYNQHSCSFLDSDADGCSAISDSKLNAVYECCLSFAKWYLENKSE
jgi:hypothetical protein